MSSNDMVTSSPVFLSRIVIVCAPLSVETTSAFGLAAVISLASAIPGLRAKYPNVTIHPTKQIAMNPSTPSRIHTNGLVFFTGATAPGTPGAAAIGADTGGGGIDRKSTRLNS